MNDKQTLIYEVLDIVIRYCETNVDDKSNLTREDILGPSRCENIIMTRCLFATQMVFMGFSRTTIAKMLHRTEKAVGNMLQQAHQFRIQSYAYRLAEAESTILLKEVIAKL